MASKSSTRSTFFAASVIASWACRKVIDRQDERHVRMLALILPAYISLLIDESDRGNIPDRALLKEIKLLKKSRLWPFVDAAWNCWESNARVSFRGADSLDHGPPYWSSMHKIGRWLSFVAIRLWKDKLLIFDLVEKKKLHREVCQGAGSVGQFFNRISELYRIYRMVVVLFLWNVKMYSIFEISNI
jgi:hypothetical protein